MPNRTTRVQREVGARIAELRRARGDTQESFAERARMPVASLARLEQGRTNATLATFVRVAAALGVSLIELFRAPRTAARARPGRPRKT